MPGENITRTNVPHDYRLMQEELWQVVNELVDSITAVAVDWAAMKVIFDAHTHNADGSESGSYYVSPPRSNTADVTAGTASVVAADTVTTPTKMSHG